MSKWSHQNINEWLCVGLLVSFFSLLICKTLKICSTCSPLTPALMVVEVFKLTVIGPFSRALSPLLRLLWHCEYCINIDRWLFYELKFDVIVVISSVDPITRFGFAISGNTRHNFKIGQMVNKCVCYSRLCSPSTAKERNGKIGGISIGANNKMCDLRHADDTVQIADTEIETVNLSRRARETRGVDVRDLMDEKMSRTVVADRGETSIYIYKRTYPNWPTDWPIHRRKL